MALVRVHPRISPLSVNLAIYRGVHPPKNRLKAEHTMPRFAFPKEKCIAFEGTWIG